MTNRKNGTKAERGGLVLFPDLDLDEPEHNDEKAPAYDPLPSTWEGTDAELLERMLDFYPKKPPKKILDATINAGRFWTGRLAKCHRALDIDPRHKPDVVGDNTDMPFEDASFDVIVYDPPHSIPNQGKDKNKDFNKRFGLVLKSSPEQGYNFSHLYPPFCKEAYRVLRKDGVLFCKIADYVHGHRLPWAPIELLNAAVAVGFTACDCIVKIRKGPIVDPRWKNAHHAPGAQYCYWLVFRKSKNANSHTPSSWSTILVWIIHEAWTLHIAMSSLVIVTFSTLPSRRANPDYSSAGHGSLGRPCAVPIGMRRNVTGALCAHYPLTPNENRALSG